MIQIWDVAFLDLGTEHLFIFIFFKNQLDKNMNIQHKSKPEKRFTTSELHTWKRTAYKSSSSSASFFFSQLLQIHFRSWLTQTSLPFHLSTGRNAKPISSCISLIRDFNMCHPLGGEPPWHIHNTHTQTHRPILTAYSNYWPSLSHGLHLR